MSELLGQPEYLHILVDPVLTHVLPFAAVGLLLALLFRSPAATRLALLLVLLSAAAVWPTVHYGHAGFDRVKSMADSAGGDWLDIHKYRAVKWAPIFYVNAIAALAALVASWKWPKRFIQLSWLAMVVTLATCAAAVYVAYPAGKIRHRELRNGPPPAEELQAARTAGSED